MARRSARKPFAAYPSWPVLTAEEVHQMISAQVSALLPNLLTGTKCDPQTVSDVVVKASVDGVAIEGVCHDLAAAPCGVTVRAYLNDALSVAELHELEIGLQAQLRGRLPKRLWRAPLELALDFHDEPFYGHDPLLRAYACRGSARAGTTWFYRVATVYVVHRGVPHTLGLAFVLPEQTPLQVLQTLLVRVKSLGLAVGGLYLDKGFCAPEVRAYLHQVGQPAIIACPLRGKTGGTRALCRGRRSYFADYTFNAATSRADTARLAVVRTYARRHGQRRAVWLLYVVIHLDGLTPDTIRARYRARFGVEGSYRSMRQTRAVTTSRNPALRFFLLGVAFLLLNLWVSLRWHFCQRPRRGGRTVHKPSYELQRHRAFLRRVIEQRYNALTIICAQAAPLDP